ncbi:hypothetical protein [Marinomonas epiphytica]
MSLLLRQHLKSLSLPQPRWPLLGAILILSVLPWYPHYSALFETRLSQSLQPAQPASVMPVRELSPLSALQPIPSWLVVAATPTSHSKQWQLVGSVHLKDWQPLLAVLAKERWELISLSWRQAESGVWKAELMLKESRQASGMSWLPIEMHTPLQISHEWKLLSSLSQQGVWSALLTVNEQKRWVTAGSWLPSEGLWVSDIQHDRVLLQTPQGEVFKVRQHKEVKNEAIVP